ncbi:hypothetical protein [Streptomyces sp. cg2]|uniref:hypothetical protein n=1 Tax=Streptomyces sp. cg2 TaxID=3238799 RepID=UPI0034E28EE7
MESSGATYVHDVDGSGKFTARQKVDDDGGVRAEQQAVDNDGDGIADGVWLWPPGGDLYFGNAAAPDGVRIGTGWNIYTKLLS